MEQTVSHVNPSSGPPAELGSIKSGQNTHAEHVASMATRVAEREESMALSAWHLRYNAPRLTLLIDEHVLRLGTSLVGFM